MESVSNNVFLFADLAPAYQEAVQKGIGYDGTSYNLKDGTKITIVAEGYQVDAPKSETVIPGVLEEVADGIVPAPENDLAKTPVEALAPAAEVVASTGGVQEEVQDVVQDDAATNEVAPTTENAPEQSTEANTNA
jgi:hypothetical protein